MQETAGGNERKWDRERERGKDRKRGREWEQRVRLSNKRRVECHYLNRFQRRGGLRVTKIKLRCPDSSHHFRALRARDS